MTCTTTVQTIHMHFPTPQGQSCPTFKPPPLDGSLLLPEIFDHHAQHNPNHPLFRYVNADSIVQTISWSDAVRAFHEAARIATRLVNPIDSGARPVIAIVVSTDQITYLTIIAGILRAGYQAFPISPRNSDVAIAHLLRSGACNHVFVSTDPAMQKLVGAAAAKLSAAGAEVNMIPIPRFEELFKASAASELLPPMRKLDLEDPAVMLHSSGSTAFPKIITFTFRTLMESGLIPYYGEIDVCGQVLAVHAVPMFHLMGVIQLPWTTFAGLTIAVFPPSLPPLVPTPDKVFDGAMATNSTLLFCVPAFLESWAREDVRLAALKKFKTVIFAGGPLQPLVGDMLVRNHVNIAHVYGLTETSNMTLFLPKSPPTEGWDYFYLSAHVDPVFVPVSDIPEVYHLIVKKCPTHTPAILDTVVDGVPALNTNDLFLRHSVNHKLWKVFGRLDDQIMHSTGEKTNPVPLEAILLKDSRIKYAVMFGRAKFHAGVLIFPAEPFDLADKGQLIEFRREIWPTVEECNRFAPTHSRIFKEMILVADPTKPIELTAKGTPRRQAILDMYQDEIRDVYIAVEESSQTHLRAPEKYDAQGSLQFVRSVVAEVMLEMPGDDDDIFQHGCDSLQATWIRNSILHALQGSKQVDVRAMPSNFVYCHPTLRLLADLLNRLASGSTSNPEDISISLRITEMEAMVQKYSRNFLEHRAIVEQPKTEAVLVTGTTGALGSHIIAELLALPNLPMVYALNRPGLDITGRQSNSFTENGIDIQLLNSPNLRLLQGDLNTQDFGLSQDDYQEIQLKVTTIIHNGWQVNFNFSLSSMEPLVAGTRQLIDFVLSSPHPVPPRLIFVSTAGIFRNWNEPVVATESHLPDPSVSIGLGYTESKWVAERILEMATQETPVSTIIIRPTQLSGASNGAWKTNDWFPALLRSSQLLGHLPAITGRISWVPIHHAAKAIVEMRTSKQRYLHITHPHPVSTADVLPPLSEALDLPLVHYPEWLNSLESAAVQESAASTNPGVRLMDFFRSNGEGSPDQEVFFPALLSNTHAVKVTDSLRSLPPLASGDIKAWVAYLRAVHYLS
ncbi:hypothetical protein B0H10DRAFT_2085224 [Mycena sp. CBHHK59/15]|nr:hypothetical protein B0H10DRAFT_2085224 [Mycena sp. CBHHK59/15]